MITNSKKLSIQIKQLKNLKLQKQMKAKNRITLSNKVKNNKLK